MLLIQIVQKQHLTVLANLAMKKVSKQNHADILASNRKYILRLI